MVALLHALHARADLDDDAGALVPEDRREQPFRIGAREGVFVGVADAGRLDLDQNLAGLRPLEIDLRRFRAASSPQRPPRRAIFHGSTCSAVGRPALRAARRADLGCGARPTSSPCGSRSHPSAAATGSRRARARAPSAGRGCPPSARVDAGLDDRRDEGGELRLRPAARPRTARCGRSRARRRGACCSRSGRTCERRSRCRHGADRRRRIDDLQLVRVRGDLDLVAADDGDQGEDRALGLPALGAAAGVVVRGLRADVDLTLSLRTCRSACHP